ncbi:MAG: hypothetical protein EBT45_06085, partial [Alphaproteobacteria bacterium]|nr:hypothetical protein [Alphaproteobacteria bacterium]
MEVEIISSCTKFLLLLFRLPMPLIFAKALDIELFRRNTKIHVKYRNKVFRMLIGYMRVSSEGERQVTDLRSSHLTRFCNLTQYPIKQSLDQNPEKAAFIKRYVPDLKDVLAYKFMNLGVILRCHQPNPHFQLWRRVE